ncbi:hypothetical protein C7T94_04345 [Pedobacter yulinensis]|uniref:Uncharacterized protein n=1 Tax=Pedobacter yulinensis TaxID=2126353 RepID=A0A2T3HNE8_9SPHI|nr:hypothetical protein [Pedobacter yulinensis]PST83975.1 hypothetical protein C7T94_04345 [Pedobacter yulinensis]
MKKMLLFILLSVSSLAGFAQKSAQVTGVPGSTWYGRFTCDVEGQTTECTIQITQIDTDWPACTIDQVNASGLNVQSFTGYASIYFNPIAMAANQLVVYYYKDGQLRSFTYSGEIYHDY